MRAFVCRDAMEGVGLRQLNGTDLAPAFAAAGVLPQTVTARIGVSKFISVNTLRGRWALVDGLATTPIFTPAPVAATPVPATASRQEVHHAAAAAQRKPVVVNLEQLEGAVRSVAAEVLGGSELESDGHFPAGGRVVGFAGDPVNECLNLLYTRIHMVPQVKLVFCAPMCVHRWL